jgi:tetratricopeptide (TPR) repeat protein
MLNISSLLFRFLLPLALIYLAYTFIGPIGGFSLLILFIIVSLWFNRAIIYNNRANKKYHSGDFDAALDYMRKAALADPKSARIRGTYAYLLLKLGYIDKAAHEIDKAMELVKLDIDKNHLRLTKGLILWKQGKIDEAIQELEELLKVYENTSVYASLGFLYIEKGDLDKALQFNLEAHDFNSNSPIIMDNLGVVYYLRGEYDKAFETYRNLMRLKPSFPDAYYNYARVLLKKGDLEKAQYMTRYALSLPFWSISTVTREEAEEFLRELEAKAAQSEVSLQNENAEASGSSVEEQSGSDI